MINKLLRLFMPFWFKEPASVIDQVTFPAKYEKEPEYLSGKRKRGRPRKQK